MHYQSVTIRSGSAHTSRKGSNAPSGMYLLLFFYMTICASLVLNIEPARAGTAIEPTQARIQTPFVPGHYRALIIGNDNYQDPVGRWPQLNTAVADAKAMETLLRENYGFSDIIHLRNAGRRDMLLALRELSQRVLPNDSVLVYYAGHGYLDNDTNKGFWVPVDAKGDDYTTYLRNSTIRDELSIIADRAKHTLLIADSCFSGTLLRRGASKVLRAEQNDSYFNKVAQKKSVQIITSGGIEYVDDNYRQSGHSPFSYFLMNELKHNDQPMVTVSELSTNVTKAVANNVDQTPSSGVLAGSGDELGEFIFVKVKLKLETSGIAPEKVKVQVELEQDGAPTKTITLQTPGEQAATTKLKESATAPVPATQKPPAPATTTANETKKKSSTKSKAPSTIDKPAFYPMPSL